MGAMASPGATCLEAGAAAWPQLHIDAQAFIAHVETVARAHGNEALCEHGADLFLAFACAQGDDAAIAAFEATHFVVVKETLARLDRKATLSRDEVLQQVRERLWVAPTRGGRPRIAEYAGQGSLRAWLKVVVTRLVLNAVTRAVPESPADAEALEALLPAEDSPELAHAKHRYRDEFREAFREAADALTPRERLLLRYSLADRLSIDEIGALYGVHRATAARWLSRTSETLKAKVIAGLRARLALEGAALDEVLRLILSQVEVSLARVLGPAIRDSDSAKH